MSLTKEHFFSLTGILCAIWFFWGDTEEEKDGSDRMFLLYVRTYSVELSIAYHARISMENDEGYETTADERKAILYAWEMLCMDYGVDPYPKVMYNTLWDMSEVPEDQKVYQDG